MKGRAVGKPIDISLVIPCYNEARNLGAFFKAATECFAQTSWTCELVFVSDGSTDDTMVVLGDAIAAYQQSARLTQDVEDALASDATQEAEEDRDADTMQVAKATQGAEAARSAEELRDAGEAQGTQELRDAGAARGEEGSSPMVFTVVELSRNFGKEAALFAGLKRAHGRYVGFIDADMQQDPGVALRMFRFLDAHGEYDCVAAVQDKRRESAVLRGFKRAFYVLFNGMSDTKILADVSDFRVFTRKVADALLMMGEQFRFSKGLFAWVGFRTHVVTYEVRDRMVGKSRWSFRSLASYAWNGILAFSMWPLKLIMLVGVVLALVSIVLLGLEVYFSTISPDDVAMSQILLDVVLLLGGIQMFVLGVIGEYVARAYIEAKRRPVCIVREEYSTAEAATQPAQGLPHALGLQKMRGETCA